MSVSIELKDRVSPDGKAGSLPDGHGDVSDETVKNTPRDVADNDDDPEEIARVKEYQSRPIFRRYFLEFVYFLYIFATVLYGVPLNTLMNDKSCLFEYGYNASVCSVLQEQPKVIKNPVLAYTNTYSTIRDVVINVPAGLAAVVVGNYLTRYGFRVPLIVVLVGGTITCVLQLVTALIMPAHLIFNALADFPGSIAGGSIVISTAAYTNIALRVPRSMHLRRITTTSICAGTGVLFAIFSGAKLNEILGIEILFGLCIGLLMIPTVLVILFLEDIDVPEENKKDSWRESLWLSLKNGLKTSINVVSQKRPDRRRPQIICVLIAFAACTVGTSASGGAFAIAYTRNVLGYTPFQYTLYGGCSILLSFGCLYPMITLSKKLKWSPPVMIASGSFFFVLKLTMLTLTEFFKPLFYIQIFVGIPYVLAPISMRTYITSLVERSEVSAVMTLLSMSEKFVPLASGLLGSYVFTLTNMSFPGCYYLILTFVYFIPISLGLYCRMMLSRNKRDAKESTRL